MQRMIPMVVVVIAAVMYTCILCSVQSGSISIGLPFDHPPLIFQTPPFVLLCSWFPPTGSAFVHFNTGITELEYFGKGRFLLMCSNHTPHFSPEDYSRLRSGGSLKDGWSYIVPNVDRHLDNEVHVAFSDEEIDEHIKEQTEAMRALYLTNESTEAGTDQDSSDGVSNDSRSGGSLEVEEVDSKKRTTFVVKRGLQVVACGQYNESTGRLQDIVLRPSARKSQVGQSLIEAVRNHVKKQGRSNSLLVKPTDAANKDFLKALGFVESKEDAEHVEMEINP